MWPFARVIVKTDSAGNQTFAIEERNWIMYFLALAAAISTGVIVAKAVRAYAA